jgi:hypothetical protein
MLVGEHGRVIPLRRFKALAVTILILFFLTVSALIGLSILYTHQLNKTRSLQSRLQEVQLRAERLRNERDVNLAKLVMGQERQIDTGDMPRATEGMDRDGAGLAPQEGVEQTSLPGNPAATRVDDSRESGTVWDAEAKDVDIGYDHEKRVFNVRFKVYNTSKPKRVLSGRCVVILKQGDDPPIKWLVIPHVLLSNGRPGGDTGHAFHIRNYRTLEFKAVAGEAATDWNTATIFIFSADGDELFNKDFAFSTASAPGPVSPRTHESSSQSSDTSPTIDPQSTTTPSSEVNGGTSPPPPATEMVSPEEASSDAGTPVESGSQDPLEADEPSQSNPEGAAQ